MYEDLEEQLESYMDKFGMAGTLALLSGIAEQKSEHIMESYQDESLSNAWEEAGEAIDLLSLSDEIQRIE